MSEPPAKTAGRVESSSPLRSCMELWREEVMCHHNYNSRLTVAASAARMSQTPNCIVTYVTPACTVCVLLERTMLQSFQFFFSLSIIVGGDKLFFFHQTTQKGPNSFGVNPVFTMTLHNNTIYRVCI